MHDSETDIPSSLLVCRSGDAAYDSLAVIYNGRPIISSGYIDTVSLTEVKPSAGSGLIKRSLNVSIAADGPFTASLWTRKLYSAGLNPEAFYFSLWVARASTLNTDIVKNGLCLGKFVIDSSLDWSEQDTVVNLNLIDVSQSFDKKLNYFPQAAVDKLQGTEWEALLNSNMHVGTFTKAPMIGQQNSTTVVVGAADATATLAAGTVTYYTATDIGLGNSLFLQANIGATLKVVFSSGEIIQGVIQTDGTNYKLHITGRDAVWATVDIAANVANSPVDANLKINQCKLSSLTDILVEGMYVKVPVLNFFNTTTPGNLVVNNKIIRLGAIQDKVNRIVAHSDITDPVSTARTLFGISYSGTTTNSAFPSDTQFNYAVANAGAGSGCSLYFRDTSTAAVNPNVGDSWTIYKAGSNNTGAAADSSRNSKFIRAIGSTVAAVYAKSGSSYYKLGAGQYTVAYNYTFQGIDNLIKVDVTGNWATIVPGSTDTNFEVCVDLLNSVNADKLIKLITKTLAPEYLKYFGYTFDGSAVAAPGMLCNAIITTDDTLTSVLDSLLYETGCVLRWLAMYEDREYRLEIDDHINSNITAAYWPHPEDSAYAYCKPIASQVITNSEIISGSLRIGVGKLDTNYSKTTGTEWISAWLRLSVPVSINDSASYLLKTNRTRERKDRFIDYTFRHAIDAAGAQKTASDMLRAPHALCAMQTTRTVNLLLSINRLDLEAGDVVDLRNIPLISDQVDPPLYKAADGTINYRYTNDTKYVLLPNLFQVESISLNFSIGSYGIGLNLKQVQFGWYPNTTGSGVYGTTSVPDTTAIPSPVDPGNPISPTNPAVPPPTTQCAGTPTDTPATAANPVLNASNTGCGVQVTCDTPENPGTVPTSPTHGSPCVENPRLKFPNADIYFNKQQYLYDSPASVPIKLLIDCRDIDGVGIEPLFPYFEASVVSFGAPFAPVHCATLSGPGGVSGTASGATLGTGEVGNCGWDSSNIANPVNLSSWIRYIYTLGKTSGHDSAIAVAQVFLKPLMIPSGSTIG